jgi:hypothetical protein
LSEAAIVAQHLRRCEAGRLSASRT